MSVPVSAFIIAFNEEDRIAEAITSVKDWAAEVVVVDSGSTDATVALAQSLGARVVKNAWPGFGPQKRFAEEQCAHDWLFNLDADERVSPALAKEISALMHSGTPPAACYTVCIKDQFAHETAPALWAYGYRQIRLYNRRVARFSDSLVHDTVRPPAGAEIQALKGTLAHRSLRSLSHAVTKSNAYSDMQRDDILVRGKTSPLWRLLTEFPLAFCKSYILRRNVLYGGWGFVLAMNYAWSRFLRIAKYYEATLGRRD